jgi:hypothetical protein
VPEERVFEASWERQLLQPTSDEVPRRSAGEEKV